VTRCVRTVVALTLSAGVLAGGQVSAAPDNARGCPPGWASMPTAPPAVIPDPIPEPGGDAAAFVWSNIIKTEGFADYMGLLDNNANGVLCVRWAWGERLADQSWMNRTYGEQFDPLYFFILRDDTSAAPDPT
jgi:hypothetical protein